MKKSTPKNTNLFNYPYDKSENKFPEFGGYCTSPNFFNKKTGKPDPNGILSEQIFGPTVSFKCTCGYLRHRTLDYGKTCPKCGTKCISNESRLKTFGKIKMIFPFILSTHKKDVLNVIGKKNKILLNPRLVETNLLRSKYICLSPSNEILVISSIDELPNGYTFIPFTIRGLFSLFFILKYINTRYNNPQIKEIFDKEYITNTVDVLPVDVRPVFKNKKRSNSLFYEEINRYYVSLINSNKRNILISTAIIEDVLTWEQELDERIKNGNNEPYEPDITEIEQITSFNQTYIDNIYAWCFSKIRGKEGIIRSNVLSRTLEFSARTVIVVDPSINPYEIKVPRPTLYSLWMPYFLHYITVLKRYYNCDEAYYEVATKNYYEVQKIKKLHDYFVEFLNWFSTSEEAMDYAPDGVNKSVNIRQISWWNRQPSLWSHSCPCMKLIPRDDEEYVLGINPLAIEPLNADFDGDITANYINHARSALEEMYQKAYLQNVVKNDSNDTFLSTIRHDALYCAFIITQDPDKVDPDNPICSIKSLNKLPLSSKHLKNIHKTVIIGGKPYTYGVALFNYWCGFDHVVLNKNIAKKQIQEVSETIYDYYECDSKKYYDALGNLERNLMAFITISNFIPTINIDQMSSIVDNKLHELMVKIPSNQQYVAYYLNDALIDRAVDSFDHECSLYKLYKSGSRFNKQQLARSCINIGLVADENNIIDPEPINTSLIEGLTEKEFFVSSFGTRKGLVDKARATPASGYLTRTLVMSLGCLEIVEDDCGTEDGINVEVRSLDHAKSIIYKYYKLKQNEEWKLINNLDDAKSLIGKEIILRSPMKCHTKDFKLCKKCYGERPTRTKYVGITAGQCITERLTQLSMRSFHSSGSAQLEARPEFSKLIKKHLIDIRKNNKKIELVFDTNEFPLDEIKQIDGYKSCKGNSIFFDELNKDITNYDVVTVIGDINDMLKKKTKIEETPDQYYDKLISAVLTVGGTYSSFVEMMLTHQFLVDEDNFWRYNYDKPPVMKLSDKAVAAKISPLLGFLFQPNKITINGFTDSEINALTHTSLDHKLTFHERIFLQKYQLCHKS